MGHGTSGAARTPDQLHNPVFNVEDYVADCVDSITRQAFKHIEIIAVDGASEDTSGKLLDDISKKEPRLTVVHMSENGPGRARNEGVGHATGEYIWFVDGDDIVSPDCLTLSQDISKPPGPTCYL